MQVQDPMLDVSIVVQVPILTPVRVCLLGASIIMQAGPFLLDGSIIVCVQVFMPDVSILMHVWILLQLRISILAVPIIMLEWAFMRGVFIIMLVWDFMLGLSISMQVQIYMVGVSILAQVRIPMKARIVTPDVSTIMEVLVFMLSVSIIMQVRDFLLSVSIIRQGRDFMLDMPIITQSANIQSTLGRHMTLQKLIGRARILPPTSMLDAVPSTSTRVLMTHCLVLLFLCLTRVLTFTTLTPMLITVIGLSVLPLPAMRNLTFMTVLYVLKVTFTPPTHFCVQTGLASYRKLTASLRACRLQAHAWIVFVTWQKHLFIPLSRRWRLAF